VIVLIQFFYVSCDRPECASTNSVYTRFSPDSEEYCRELIDDLEKINRAELRFWFNSYKEIGSQEPELWFNVQGGDLCAIMVMKVADWTKLQHLRACKGESYRGAEFQNLRYTMIHDKGRVCFVLLDFECILD